MLYLDYAKPLAGGGYILNFFADDTADLESISDGKSFVTKNGTDYGVPQESSTCVITAPNTDKKTFVMDSEGVWVEAENVQVGLNIENGVGDGSLQQKGTVASGRKAASFGGKRIGYDNWPVTQARGNHSFAAGASCESDAEGGVAMGIGAESWQRSAVSIGKSCKSGRTIEEFNDWFATDAQKATTGYDKTKVNGGIEGMSIKDKHGDEYPDSYSMSFSAGVNSQSAGWGAFVAGLNSTALVDGAATFGNNNKNLGENSLLAGYENCTTVPRIFMFGTGLKMTEGNGNCLITGKYNVDKSGYLFVVGTGSDDTHRQNGFTINPRGQVYMIGAETESLSSNIPKAVINRTDLNLALQNKSNATNWRNGSGIATVVTQEAGNDAGNSVRILMAGFNSKATKADSSAVLSGYDNDIKSAVYSAILNGKFNVISHNNALVGGTGNETNANDQTIFGKYATKNSDALFQVGIGSSNDNRSDAFAITKDGKVKSFAVPKEDTDIVRKLELDNLKQEVETLKAAIANLNK